MTAVRVRIGDHVVGEVALDDQETLRAAVEAAFRAVPGTLAVRVDEFVDPDQGALW